MKKPRLTRLELARAIRANHGISQSFASELVNGKRLPSLRLAWDIEQSLKIPMQHWFTESPSSLKTLRDTESV